MVFCLGRVFCQLRRLRIARWCQVNFDHFIRLMVPVLQMPAWLP